MFHQMIIQPEKLLCLIQLIQMKYSGSDIKLAVATSTPPKVTVRFFNRRHGVGEGIDQDNIRPIQYLMEFGATSAQAAAEHPDSSYSNVSFDSFQLNNIIVGLNNMPTPTRNNDQAKVNAM